jgi:hypothetical protein
LIATYNGHHHHHDRHHHYYEHYLQIVSDIITLIMMMMMMMMMMIVMMTMIVMMMMMMMMTMTAVLTIMLHQFGRALRIALFNKMNRSALRIQQAYRRASVGMMTLLRTRQIRLALIMQKLYRGRVGKEALRRLRMEALQRVAAANLQRVYRGYLGDRSRRYLQRYLYEDKGDRHLPTILSSSSLCLYISLSLM